MNNSLQSALESDNLPSLPQVAVRVIEVVQRKPVDTQELIKIIKSDPAICARVLKATNSALFGLRPGINSIERAVPILGPTLLRTLVLSFSLMNNSGRKLVPEKVMQRVWRQALTQAVAAELLAEVSSIEPSSAFIAGLLQDIGVIGLLNIEPEKYSELVLRDLTGEKLLAEETTAFGIDHVDLGVAMIENWGLSEISQAIRDHHSHNNGADKDSLSGLLFLAAQVSDSFEHPDGTQKLATLVIESLGIPEERACELLDECKARSNEMAAIFSIDIGDYPAIQILTRANQELSAAAMSAHLECRAATRSAQEAEKLASEAYRDSLTGIYNRRFFANALDLELDKEKDFGILFLDIDRFKQLNDQHGHQAGDEALKRVAGTIERMVRDQDVVARLGGDEFVVLLCNVSANIVERISGRISEAINQIVIETEETTANISSSIGAVFCSGNDSAACDPNRVLNHADRAMYRAKNQGGGRFEFVVQPNLETAI